MKPDIRMMHKVWDVVKMEDKSPARLPKINFDDIISSIFTTGPFYYYVIDFCNMGVSHLSSGFEEIHGIKTEDVISINDILGLIHPEDMSFALKAEKRALDFVISTIGAEKFTRYKGSYNLRFKTADGSYRLFNHQALTLSMDENNKFIKSLNIHTNISHLTCINNYKFSLIGLAGEPSYLNINVDELTEGKSAYQVSENIFTKREIEIIKLLAEGLSTKFIAERLFISPATAETHRKNILRKSGCENSVKLVARSISEGWI